MGLKDKTYYCSLIFYIITTSYELDWWVMMRLQTQMNIAGKHDAVQLWYNKTEIENHDYILKSSGF